MFDKTHVEYLNEITHKVNAVTQEVNRLLHNQVPLDYDPYTEIVLRARILPATKGMPKAYKEALNASVKAGVLKRLAGKRLKSPLEDVPAVYYHPNFEFMAKSYQRTFKDNQLRYWQEAASRQRQIIITD